MFENLTGNQSQGGSLLDFALQMAVPGFGIMRNMSAMFNDDPNVRNGTLVGGFMGDRNGPGWFGGGQSDNLGFGSSSPYQSGYNISDGGWFGTGIGADVGSNTGLGGAFAEDAYDVSQGTIGSTGYDSYGGYSADDEGDAQAESDWG